MAAAGVLHGMTTDLLYRMYGVPTRVSLTVDRDYGHIVRIETCYKGRYRLVSEKAFYRWLRICEFPETSMEEIEHSIARWISSEINYRRRA